jgi:hypothetical protein
MRIMGSNSYLILSFFIGFIAENRFFMVETGHALSLHGAKSVTKMNFIYPA